jgi:hypothetical protein
MEIVVRVREKRREGVEPAQRQERLLGDLKRATELEGSGTAHGGALVAPLVASSDDL